MPQMRMTENDTVALLRQSKDPEVQKFAKDAGVVASLIKIFNASLDIAANSNGSKSGIALAFTQKGLETSNLMSKVVDSPSLSTANTIFSVGMANQALLNIKNVTNVSPARVLTTAGLVTINKVLILGGMQNKHKCALALGSLATTTGLTIAASPTGIGLVVGVIGVLAEGIEAYGQCKPQIDSFLSD